MEAALSSILRGGIALITVVAILKTITILIKGQTEGIPLKESLLKVKRVLMAAAICICISAIIHALKTYY